MTCLDIVTILILRMTLCAGQQIYSATIQWMPIGNTDEIQFYTHLSWEPTGGKLTCPASEFACLTAYRAGKNVQTFGRITNFHWNCTSGCHVTNGLISDLSSVYFTDIRNKFQNVTWEAGDETFLRNFSSASDNISLRFRSINGTLNTTFGYARLSLAVRNDTRRLNLSPSLVVLPVYILPLGCNIQIDLHPYDGDGDSVVCKWYTQLKGGTLDTTNCRVSIQTSTSNNYSAGHVYSGSVYGEDFSQGPVRLTRGSSSSTVSTGPFSRVPAMFTIHITPALADIKQCNTGPDVEGPTNNTVSYIPPFTYTDVFNTTETMLTFVNVGHQKSEFVPDNTSEHIKFTETNALYIGIYRTCVMAYNQLGVPGNSVCNTLLVGDTDECANNSCTANNDGTCTGYYKYHTCSYPPSEEPSVNIGLIAGIAAGCVALLATVVIAILLCKRHAARKKRKVASEQNDVVFRKKFVQAKEQE